MYSVINVGNGALLYYIVIINLVMNYSVWGARVGELLRSVCPTVILAPITILRITLYENNKENYIFGYFTPLNMHI